MRAYGRETKEKVGNILMETDRKTALEKLTLIPDEQLVGPLFSYFYNNKEVIKFRSITAMGVLVARMAKQTMEKARVVMRRLMWNLNDESGGIGWGSPEAMGEILSQSPELAPEYKSILFSYLDPNGNHIEHEMLQRGVLWGIGTYLESHPLDLSGKTKELLYGYLHSKDPVKRAYCVRALFNSDSFQENLVPEHISTDNNLVDLFTGWDFASVRMSDIAKNRERKRFFA